MNEEEFLNEQIRVLWRKLKRLQGQLEVAESKYHGNEREYTFHGGFDYGYIVGKIYVLEDIIDSLEDRALPYKQERLGELYKSLNNI